MVTERRPWPNGAAWLRDGAAQELVVIVRALQPVVEGAQFDRTEMLRRQAVALSAAWQALSFLVQAGAGVRAEVV